MLKDKPNSTNIHIIIKHIWNRIISNFVLHISKIGLKVRCREKIIYQDEWLVIMLKRKSNFAFYRAKKASPSYSYNAIIICVSILNPTTLVFPIKSHDVRRYKILNAQFLWFHLSLIQSRDNVVTNVWVYKYMYKSMWCETMHLRFPLWVKSLKYIAHIHPIPDAF